MWTILPTFRPPTFRITGFRSSTACYTCHTDYAMFGTVHAKLEGLHHVYVYWFGTPMKPIRLYQPYNNRECLHCHEGARSFED